MVPVGIIIQDTAFISIVIRAAGGEKSATGRDQLRVSTCHTEDGRYISSTGEGGREGGMGESW